MLPQLFVGFIQILIYPQKYTYQTKVDSYIGYGYVSNYIGSKVISTETRRKFSSGPAGTWTWLLAGDDDEDMELPGEEDAGTYLGHHGKSVMTSRWGGERLGTMDN